jgi:acetyl esterase
MNRAVRALLEAMVAATPPVEELSPEEARAVQVFRRQQLGPVEAEPVAQVIDRCIPGPGGALPIRVYLPRVDRSRPAVVYFHGGGWVLCDLDSHDALCRRLCNASEMTIVSVGYRRAPEHRFPAAVDDAVAAIRWVTNHPGEIGVRSGPIAVAGDSAGGNLAAAAALALRAEPGPAIALQVLLYPVLAYDFTTESYRRHAAGPALTLAAMQWYWGHYLAEPDDGRSPLASPLLAESLAGMPDAYVVVAGLDPLRDEGVRYVQRLHEAGGSSTLVEYHGMFHGFVSYQAQLPAARNALTASAAALADAFG